MPKKDITLSVALAVYNEERNLRTCLSSVSPWADEIVVIDGGSTDATVSIAREFGAKIIQTDNPPIFHINKQKALEKCRGAWILQLDADEVIPSELRDEILNVIKSSDYFGFYIPRKNIFSGHWLRKGGQYPDYVIRLIQKGKGRFPCISVHEQIAVDGIVGYMKNPLIHNTYRSIREYWKKSDSYTTLTAKKMKETSVPINIISYLKFNVIRPTITFMSLFIRHKGFLDGIYGFLFALFSALHHPIAYRKYISSRNNLV